MTAKEAIKTLHELYRETNDHWYEEVYDMAISALEAQEVKNSNREVKNSNQEVKNSSDLINRQAAIEAMGKAQWAKGRIRELPSAQPEWNNHTVACMLAELFNDTCACNYNGIDEWLPFKCELLDACPHPVGVACWEQFLKHRGENNGRLN